MTTDVDQLVEDYLDRLETELDDLPRARRRELVQEIATHIDEGRQQAKGEVDVRNLLDKLGDPADIAAEARDRIEAPAPAPVERGRAVEIWALIMLSVGSLVLPVLGWLVGVVLLWSSRIWTTREKLVGTLLVPGGLGAAALLLFLPLGSAESCTITAGPQGDEITACTGGYTDTEQALLISLLVVLVIVPIATLLYLIRRMNQRTAASAPVT